MLVRANAANRLSSWLLRGDDTALCEIDQALHRAEHFADDIALGTARIALGLALVHRESAADRDRGLQVLAQVRDMCHRGRFYLTELPTVEVYTARERARRGDLDGAIPLMRNALDDLVRAGQLLGWGVASTGVLVETLLERGADGDVREAEAAIDKSAAAPADAPFVARDILLLRLHALLARARGDVVAYRDLVGRYGAMATSLAFEGHMAMAEILT